MGQLLLYWRTFSQSHNQASMDQLLEDFLFSDKIKPSKKQTSSKYAEVFSPSLSTKPASHIDIEGNICEEIGACLQRKANSTS